MRGLSKLLLISLALAVPAHVAAKQPDPGSDASGEEEDGFIEGDETPAEGDEEAPPEGEEPAAPVEAPPPTEGEDLEALRAEYFKVRDRLFQSKARASAVASALYSTRLTVGLNYGSGRYYTITRATIRLDGANIFDDSEGVIASNKAPRFEGYVAPGRHQLSIRIEATGKDDQRFTSVIENSFVVQAVKGKDLHVKASAEDGGDIAYKWKKKEQGSYQLHLDVSVKSKKRGKKPSEHIKRTERQAPHAAKTRKG